jgi:preflagellin peptidase FlaK
MDWLVVARLVVALAILGYASYTDWRSREASDLNWIAMGVVGLVLLAIDIGNSGGPVLLYLILVPIAIIFSDMFWDRKGMFEDGVHPLPLALYAAAALIIAVLLVDLRSDAFLWKILTILIMFALVFLLFQFGVIKGGADAKALIALALLFPSYPIIDHLPIIQAPTVLAQQVFPFALLILFNAALLSLAIPIILFFYNLAHREIKVPAMLLGYRTDLRSARAKFVWPMERLEDGQPKMILFPRGDTDENTATFDMLEAGGVDRIWVTPKVPFLIPITASIVFSVLVGNILFLLLR